MKTAVLLEATNPEPAVVAHGAPHHRAASVLLDLTITVRALVVQVARQGVAQLATLVVITASTAVPGAAALPTRLLAALANKRLVAAKVTRIQHIFAIGPAAIHQVWVDRHSPVAGEALEFLE